MVSSVIHNCDDFVSDEILRRKSMYLVYIYNI